MINYTLSDDITLTLPVNTLNTGYVNLFIYHNEIGVFTGRAYNDGTTPIEVNLNDIALQNHGKNDYLKLQDNGELLTSPMVLVDGEEMLYSRFLPGQIGNYRVTLMDASSHYTSASTNILAGYDYVNKDIRTDFIVNNGDSELGRLMQGANWVVWHDEERGVFNNTLLPHVPLKYTKKFGFGLHLGNETKTRSYSVRGTLGNDVSLGLAQDDSDMMLMTNDYYMHAISLISYDEDNIVYLRYQGSSGDEFGDWEEGYDAYKGQLKVNAIEVTIDGDTHNYLAGTAEYETYATLYNDYMETGWDIYAMTHGNTLVYDTGWQRTEYRREELIDLYEDNYAAVNIEGIIIGPIYTTLRQTKTEPDKYIGKCPICIMDVCYSRYYLAWMDKYGDIMSLAFDGKIEYSEGFEKSEVMDYKMRRRIIHNELQPKWRINSKWINEEFYPYYEAIYTSPYVLLYDTQTDRAWNVIVTDSEYREKTFKNEKKLFNLELNVESCSKQNHIF